MSFEPTMTNESKPEPPSIVVAVELYFTLSFPPDASITSDPPPPEISSFWGEL